MKRQLTKEGTAYVGHVTPILLFYLLLYVLDIDHPSSGNAPWYALTALWTSAVTSDIHAKRSKIDCGAELIGHSIHRMYNSN